MVKLSGIAFIVLGVVHLIAQARNVLSAMPAWAALDLWTLELWQPLVSQSQGVLTASAAFWKSVGSFSVPMIILGCMIIGMDRQGRPVPEYVAWSLIAWMALCCLAVEPSGFPIGLTFSVVLLAGIRRRQRACENSAL